MWRGGGVLVCRVAVCWQRFVGPFIYHFVASRWMSLGARCLVRRFVLCLSVLRVSCPLTRSECHSARSSFRSARVRVVVHCQPSARSEIAESMLILESLSITHRRLRVSLSVSRTVFLDVSVCVSLSLSLSVSLPPLVFFSLRICCVRILCRLSVVFWNLDERSERYKI